MGDAALSMPSRPYEILGNSNDRDRWLQLRRSGIGASEIAAVLGESPWSSALEVYAEKIGAAPPRDLSDVEPVYWGSRLEPAIVSGYQDRTGRPVEHQGWLLRSVSYPWALCTLDALTTDGRPGEPWPLEVKNVGGTKAVEWEDGPPPHYALQLQHQMLVTGAPRATAAALIGGNRMVWCDVERDDVAIRRIIAAGTRFWAEHVEAGKAPTPDGSESAARALAALYPHPTPGAVAQLDGALLEADAELAELKLTLAALKKRADEIEAALKAAIGTAEMGVLPNGTSYSWKEQTRAEHVVKASSFRVLRRHAANKRG